MTKYWFEFLCSNLTNRGIHVLTHNAIWHACSIYKHEFHFIRTIRIIEFSGDHCWLDDLKSSNTIEESNGQTKEVDSSVENREDCVN